MDYEKKYKEALERAKGVIEQNPLMEYLKKGIEYILPELKESDDRKIIERILFYLQKDIMATKNSGCDTKDLEECIAWLEKQGEQDPYNGVSFQYNGHTWGMCARDNGVDILLDRQLIKHLENQGEKKQDPCDNCKDVRLNCHNFPCIKKRAFEQGKSALEVIKEEPQVYDTEDGEIITYSETDGYKLYQPKFKDGDVLNSPSHHLIWIYRDNEHFYVCVNMNYVTENVAIDGLISIPNDACPATKEQREQLKKAIDDAGYAFDFDKKELKKVVAPKFKIGDTMRTLQEASNGITSGLPVVVSIDNEYYHCNNELIAIKDQDNYEYPPMNRRQKPVDNVESFDKYKGLTDFERTLADICIGWIGEEPGWEQYINDGADVLLKIAIKKFNSVQEQNPAWSEWDEEILSEIIYFFEKGIPTVQHDFRIYVSWLRSLKQRYTWKPSDEQIQCLHDAIEHYQTNGYPASKLNELYEQMSKIYKL